MVFGHDARLQLANYRSVIELLHSGSQAESARIVQEIKGSRSLESTVNSIAEARLLLRASAGSYAVSSVAHDAEQLPPAFTPMRPRKKQLQSPYDDYDFMFETQFMTDVHDQYVDKDPYVDIPDQDLPLSRWTESSDDDRLMNHLLRKFWAWDNIVEKTLFRPIFEEDAAAMDPISIDNGPRSFCSRFLVNALLALSCIYTMNIATFQDLRYPVTRGRRWVDEADTLLAQIDVEQHSFPLLQGLLALFCYEGNLGLGSKALPYYVRAMDVYKALNYRGTPHHRADMDDSRAQRERLAASWCIWGFYCCEWRGTQALGSRKLTRKPKAPKVWREPGFPLSLSKSSSYWWFPYPKSFQIQRSMKVEIREVDARLSEIVEDALDFIYPQDGTSPAENPQLALKFYRAIAHWKQSCPSRIRFEEAVLPSAILLHVSAEVMLTAILRPFTSMSKAQFGAFDPRERCYAHASSLTTAIWTFRAFSVIHHEYWLCHALGTAAYIVVGGTADASIQMDTLVRTCQCLYEMRATLPLATDISCGIHAALKRSKEPMPAFLSKYFDSLNHRDDGLMHYAVAALLPDATDIAGANRHGDVQLQELLNGTNDIGVD
ncbi:hypothetical protein QQS21_012182 [Conoideocrella luteorostrata]|uniref:Transcription factor domain-containing protein n=1 Tax=Conoideocrella luteorostrata TaxID=1105319 RepID=A0AAJ0FMM1_9HYPO|nr:hypothetical protein QQS21_012182 [Conoideocrella luteorostrata]